MQYYDPNGRQVSLRSLIEQEPEWAASRIRRCEKLETTLAKLKNPDRIFDLLDQIDDFTKGVDIYEYGIPLYDDELVAKLTKTVSDWVEFTE